MIQYHIRIILNENDEEILGSFCDRELQKTIL